MSQESNPINTPESELASDSSVSSPTVASQDKTTQSKNRRGAHPLSWVNFVLLIVLLGIAGYGGFLGWQQHQTTLVNIAILQDRLSTAEAVRTDNEQRQNNLLELAEKLNAASTELASQVTFNTDRLAKLPGAERQDWLLAEVEYLLRLANQRLMLERDWNGALSLLTAADNVLIETRNPRYNPVRAQISREIQALRAVPSIDRTGTIYKLQTLQEVITDLQWLPQQYQPQTTPSTTANTAPAAASSGDLQWSWDQLSIPMLQKMAVQWWQQAKQSVSDNIRSLIRVRRLEDDLPAPLSPNQQYYLQQNMHLMLEQAQVALLREQTALFQQSIKRVHNWVKQFVMLESDQSRAVLATLTDLQQWNAAPDLPDISVSLLNLRKLLEQQRRGSVISAVASDNPMSAVEVLP